MVGEALGLPVLVAGADIVITGEGRFDAQTDAGKVPAAVLRLAEAAGARTLLVAGSIQAPTTAFAGSVSLTEAAGSASAALADPLTHLRAVASELALWSA
ncbi:Glycerate kinase family protein [Rathayibacter tanaceti]|uniref:Glycerate kinase family protein n=1 Tax=Rathayibacter tanaceti TaxID=1671680 RepID=A0A162FWR2_9MICO|nr:Glycerate kinase family protein [Rathayibacter tanaceti]